MFELEKELTGRETELYIKHNGPDAIKCQSNEKEILITYRILLCVLKLLTVMKALTAKINIRTFILFLLSMI